MLSVNDYIHGWSPVASDGEDVNIHQDMCFMTIKPEFATPSIEIFGPICPPLDTTSKARPHPSQSTPFTPSTEASCSSIPPSSSRRAQRNRNHDPSWIPRPRNAFIIFRCEYSREHSQSSQECQSDNDSTNPTMKTLSKRAAEAWRQLPPSERERYKLLADKEREEHACLYPHYRFRPMKRQISGTGKVTRERTQSPRVPSVERPPAPSTYTPSVLAPAPERPRSSPSVERCEASAPVPQETEIPLSECSIDPRAEPPVPLGGDYNDLLPSYPGTTSSYNSSSHSAPVELYTPPCMSPGIYPDAFYRYNPASGVDLTPQDTEQAQALEAYAIGQFNYDLFSPFSFPEYY